MLLSLLFSLSIGITPASAGRFIATAYGPPWNALEGGGITSTGIRLYAGVPNYGVAVDPRVIPYGTTLRIWPNPHHYRGAFVAFDTGGAIVGRRLDFYDWKGRAHQNAWGVRPVSVQVVYVTKRIRAGRWRARYRRRSGAAHGRWQPVREWRL